jgi:hypothetical protein
MVNYFLPSESGIIFLKDLPEKEVFLWIEETYRENFVNFLSSYFPSWNEIARKLKLKINPKNNSCEFLRQLRRKRYINLGLIKEIIALLNQEGVKRFSLDELQNFLRGIRVTNGKPILNPKFPINFNSISGAILLSGVYHDGGISVRDLAPFYCNTVAKLKKRFVHSFHFLIGDYEFSKKRFWKEVVCPKIFGIYLVILGFVPGKKSINNFVPPPFLFSTSEEFKRTFLSQAIADDGYVYNPKNKIGFITINQTVDLSHFSDKMRSLIKKKKFPEEMPKTLLLDLYLFKSLGIKTAGPYLKAEKIYPHRYCQEWCFNIRELQSIKFLADTLKIPLNYKQKALENLAMRSR